MAKLNDQEKKALALFIYAGSFRMGGRVAEAKKLAHKIGIVNEFNACEDSFKNFESTFAKLFAPGGGKKVVEGLERDQDELEKLRDQLNKYNKN